ncbi:hypothetical protein [Streptomyces sp. NPDC088816]|uniref:hypothetical protein n=1 Tax=Streptomyces sp. NPDC088816 TaxID=3365906 RepID=UPI0037FE215A
MWGDQGRTSGFTDPFPGAAPAPPAGFRRPDAGARGPAAAPGARATRYEYGEDWSKVVNPAGASSYQVFIDALGRTSRVDTFNPAAFDGFTSMRYTYDAHGQLVKATN